MITITPTVNTFIEAIKSAILSTKTARLTNCSAEVLKLQNQIIETIHVDENGTLWSTASMPTQQIAQFHPHFPVLLNYFRKGCPISVEIKGTATIILDPETISNFELAILHNNSDEEKVSNQAQERLHKTGRYNNIYNSEQAIYQRYKYTNNHVLLCIVIETAVMHQLRPPASSLSIAAKGWLSTMAGWFSGTKRQDMYEKKWSFSGV